MPLQGYFIIEGEYQFFSISYLDITCKDIVVSQRSNSNDTFDCGTDSNPCLSIKHALEGSRGENITILLDGGEDMNAPYRYNILDPINVLSNLKIRKYSKIKPIITSTTKYFESDRPIFHVYSTKITLDSISFNIINILFIPNVHRLEVIIRRCHFDKIVSLQRTFLALRTSLFVHIFNSYFRNFDQIFRCIGRQNCSLTIDRSTFVGENNKLKSQLYLRNTSIPLNQVGLRFFSSPGHGRINISSSLFLYLRSIFTVVVDIMVITNCTFSSNQKPEQLFYSPDYIWVRGSLHIYNSSFINNVYKYGAIHLEGEGTVFITHSLFLNNTGDTGGGMRISTQIATVMFTKFVRNVATRIGGGLAFEGNGQIMITGSEFHNNSVQLLLNTKDQMPSGNGGAISFKRTVIFRIINCVFSGNTAPSFGGTIYYESSSQFTSELKNCTITGTKYNASLVGSLLYFSRISLKIERVTLNALTKANFQSVVYIVHARVKSIDSLKISCPVSYNLYAKELKTSYPYPIFPNVYRGLLYYCTACTKGTYNLDNGYRIFRTDSIRQNSITCHQCPNGGSCDNGLVSRDNFWGFKDSIGEVTFTHCPLLYCCSAYGQKCVSYQTCELNRRGKLCGKCISGYAENMLSTKCVENKHCRTLQFWIGIIVGTLFYTIFMLYIGEITRLANKIFSSTICILKQKELHLVCKDKDIDHKNEAGIALQGDQDSDNSMGLGIFKILIFFYQVEFLLQVKSALKKNYKISLIWTDLISSIFNFKPSSFDSSFTLCAWKNMNAVEKEVVKVSVIVVIFVLLSMLYILIVCYQKILLYTRRDSLYEVLNSYNEHLMDYLTLDIINIEKNSKFLLRVKCALSRLVLVTYIPITTVVLKLINCIPIGDLRYLYINGEIQCYHNWWQYVAICLLALWVIPFCVSLYISVDLLKDGDMTSRQFLITFIFPPVSFYYMLKSRYTKNRPQNPTRKLPFSFTDDANRKLLLQMFAAPYKSESEKWIGVVVLRKFMLTSASIFTINPVLRLYILILFLAFFLILHTRIRPYKSDMLNFCESVSLILLILFAAINLYWAHSYALYVNGKSLLYDLGEVFLFIEYVVLSLPVLVFVLLMLVTLVICVCQKVMKKCSVKEEKD